MNEKLVKWFLYVALDVVNLSLALCFFLLMVINALLWVLVFVGACMSIHYVIIGGYLLAVLSFLTTFGTFFFATIMFLDIKDDVKYESGRSKFRRVERISPFTNVVVVVAVIWIVLIEVLGV